MAINSALHVDEIGGAVKQTMALNITARQSRKRSIFSGGTKSRVMEISDLLCEGYVRFGFDDGKVLQAKATKPIFQNNRHLPQVATMSSREEIVKSRAQDVGKGVQDLFHKVTEADGLSIELQNHAVERPGALSNSLYANNVEVVYHEEEKSELQVVVEEFQLLCASHKPYAYGPDNFENHQAPEHRICKNPSSYNYATKSLCWRHEKCAGCVRRVEEVQQLQEEVKILSAKLTFSTTQREAMKDVVVASAAKLGELMAANGILKTELFVEGNLVQARKKDVRNLETRVKALSTSNQMLKSMINLKKMAFESRRSLNFTLIEPKLLDLAAIASAQNACVRRLSDQNETLARSLHSKIQESDHQHSQVITAIKQKEAAIRALEQFKQKMVEWAAEIDERNRNYDLLQEYALNLQADLRHCQSQYSAMLQSHEELRKEHDQLSALQAHTRTRIADTEKALNEREMEVERISREALHLSLEIELMRRKLRQLNEDVLFKEGQISILRDSWEVE